MKKGDVIRQKCVNTTFYLTGILAHKVNNNQTTVLIVYFIKAFKRLEPNACNFMNLHFA